MFISASVDLGVGSVRFRNRYLFNENIIGVSDLIVMNVFNGVCCIIFMLVSNSVKKFNVRGRNVNVIFFVSGFTVINFKLCVVSKSNVVVVNW